MDMMAGQDFNLKRTCALSQKQPNKSQELQDACIIYFIKDNVEPIQKGPDISRHTYLISDSGRRILGLISV